MEAKFKEEKEDPPIFVTMDGVLPKTKYIVTSNNISSKQS